VISLEESTFQLASKALLWDLHHREHRSIRLCRFDGDS